MNQECSIVRDLLPLYAERLTSPETAAFVEKHLRTCADCRAALQETQAPPAPAAPLRTPRPCSICRKGWRASACKSS